MAKVRLLMIVTLLLVSSGCASTLPQAQPSNPSPGTAEAQKKAEAQKRTEEELRERMQAEEDAFNVMSAKMDEYQDLLAVCERVPDAGDDMALKAACKEKLRVLKRELEELSAFLREEK